MIRKWTYLNELNNNFSVSFKFYKKFKIKNFRSSSIYKKFTFKLTKFKRKPLIRLKHKTNWTIYENVIKTWTKTYMFLKIYNKFQFYNNIFAHSYFVFNIGLISYKKEYFLHNFNSFYYNLPKNKFFFQIDKKKNSLIKHTGLSNVWGIEENETTPSLHILYYNFENFFFTLDEISPASLTFSEITKMFSYLLLLKNLEINKILNLFIYFNLLKNLFLKPFFFKKKKFNSPSCRDSYFFFQKINYQKKFKQLSFYKKWNAGRNDSGKIVFRTRGAYLLKQKMLKINYNLRYLCLGFIAGFQFIPFKNKLLSLLYFSNGSVTYYLSTNFHHLFFYINIKKKQKTRKIKFKNHIFMLFQIRKLSFINCVELYLGKGSQLVRSPGTKSKIIKFDKVTHTSLIELPSKLKKTLSFYTFAFLGNVVPSLHFRCSNIKSGYWRSFGIKQTVRGVAMNPVDHPHGGRTKAIRYQRTPWGHTTKYK